ncbi:MAG: Uma2 family endonuclease, partial [Planctomycetes bacterium]|nr:Uma2 family endonuclease [Planctomycetota bacterium]
MLRIEKAEIEYPESDGLPMGETDLHRWWMIRIADWLRWRYHGERVYVSGNLLIYPEEGNIYRHVSPDCFVVLDC